MWSAQVLEFYGLEKQNKWAQLGYESLFFIGFTILAWAVSDLHRLVCFPTSSIVPFSARCLSGGSVTILRGLCYAGLGICQPSEALDQLVWERAASAAQQQISQYIKNCRP